LNLNEFKPSLIISFITNEEIKMAEDKEFEIEFRAEFDAFTKQK
jgi:hypothetical protein